MASIGKTKTGFRAMVYVNGNRATKSFKTKVEAKDWAVHKEVELKNQLFSGLSKISFDKLLDEYEKRVSIHKASHAWECKQFNKLRKSLLGNMQVANIGTKDISLWKDDRLHNVSGSTVNREMNLLSNIFTNATVWQYIKKNPCKGVDRPKENPARSRLPTEDEIEALRLSCGWEVDTSPDGVQQRVYVAFLFACESAMRAGEISSQVKPDQVDGNVVHILKSKNGTKRDVPLTPRAKELINLVEDDFNLTPAQIESNFRIIRVRANIIDLHFHDSRHAGTTMLAQQIHVLDLARATGHKDLKLLMRYYNETAKDIASKLI